MKKILLTLITCSLSLLFFSCKEEESSPVKETKRITLLYAVNNSNLSYDYVENERKMLKGLSGIDTEVYPFYVYKKDSGEAKLCRAKVSTDGNMQMHTVKIYSDDMLSTDPERLKEVIADVFSRNPGIPGTLFMWGHGSGWYPEFSSHQKTAKAAKASVDPMPGVLNYSFGGEGADSSHKGDWMDLLEMAGAIPSGIFETIWFDACYMSGIEVAYELREKCRYMVAYPTEIYSDGLPYDLVLPKVVGDSPDLIGAAGTLYDYYHANSLAVTVAVMDLSFIEPLAERCRDMIKGGKGRPDFSSLKNYSRSSRYKLYDFGQFQKAYSSMNGTMAQNVLFDEALKNFILYKECSSFDFNNRPIDRNVYSGLSVHPFTDDGSSVDEYYKHTSWYKSVY